MWKEDFKYMKPTLKDHFVILLPFKTVLTVGSFRRLPFFFPPLPTSHSPRPSPPSSLHQKTKEGGTVFTVIMILRGFMRKLEKINVYLMKMPYIFEAGNSPKCRVQKSKECCKKRLPLTTAPLFFICSAVPLKKNQSRRWWHQYPIFEVIALIGTPCQRSPTH